MKASFDNEIDGPLQVKVDVKKLLSKAPVGETQTFSLEEKREVELNEENTLAFFSGEVKIIRLEDELLAQFDISYLTKTRCVRCLNIFEREGQLSFEREYLIYDSDPDGEKLRVGKHFEIDLGGPIFEELSFDIPMKPLCRENCKGIKQSSN